VLSRSRTAKLQAPTLSRAAVESLSQSRNEPAWLVETRLAAWDHYESLPMPSLKSEEWRRTDYTKIDWASAGVIATAHGLGFETIPAENRAPLVGDEQGGLLAFVDGEIVQYEINSALKAQGVIFTDLVTAAREHEGLVRPNLMTRAVLPTEGKFAALNAALWTHGVFVYVPRGVSATLPVHSVFYNTQSGLSLGHVLVVLEQGAQITYLNEYLSAPGVTAHAAFVGATELLVGDNANLRYVSLQDWGRNVYDFRHERARVSRHGPVVFWPGAVA